MEIRQDTLVIILGGCCKFTKLTWKVNKFAIDDEREHNNIKRIRRACKFNKKLNLGDEKMPITKYRCLNGT